jgi:SNF2 family DNA or RNA helicase
MKEVLGEVTVDRDIETLVCKPANPGTKPQLTSLLRTASNGTALSMDGPYFLLDMRTAVSLRSQPTTAKLKWSEEAAGWVDNFAVNYATADLARRRLLELSAAGVAERALLNYPPRERLDAHQLVAVAALTDPYISGVCLFDEQGSGKTVMAIHAFDRLRQIEKVDGMLVFAPKNMLEEWKKDFRRFTGDKYAVRSIAGSRIEKYEGLIGTGDVFITNYETAHVFEQPLRSLLLRSQGRVVMVVDESFFVKNRETKRAAAVRRLRHLCQRCWVLCGTPAPNNSLDVIHQFDVADAGTTFSGVKLPKDPELLRSIIKNTVEHKGVYLRRLKRDVLPELPNKRFERVIVPMEPEQGRLYANELKHLVADVEAVDDASFKKQVNSFLARRIALFQLCSHPGQINRNYKSTPGKHLALDGLLTELISKRGEKVVLWSFFRYSLDHLMTRYQKFNPVRLDGTISDTKRRSDSIQQFQEDDKTMLFVANPAAGGAGITLTRARVAIYESFPIQTASYLQSLDRIHRRGQTKQTDYYFLLCQDSIEEDEYNRLLLKEKLSSELFGDPEPDIKTREIFLADLLNAMKKLC